MTITLQTLKGLDLVANVTTVIPSTVATFYSSVIAQGTGPNGTFLLTDLLPGAAGTRENPALTAAVDLINSGATTALDQLYAQMVSVVDSTYGTPPTITIPSGPAAGVYATYDAALQALVVASNAEIGAIAANAFVAGQVATANDTWSVMARAWALSPNAQSNASISLGTLPASAQLPVTAFIVGLPQQGTDTEVGMSAQYLESVADNSTQGGQAVIAALREGRDRAALDAVGIGHDDSVPDQPTTLPPQAELGDANYTVSQARTYVESNLTS